MRRTRRTASSPPADTTLKLRSISVTSRMDAEKMLRTRTVVGSTVTASTRMAAVVVAGGGVVAMVVAAVVTVVGATTLAGD